jgi:beta-glucosidase
MSGELGFYDIVAGNMGDRNDLKLWSAGDSLVQSVAASNQNTIVVVHSVGPVSMSWSDHPNVTGIVYAGAPGEQTGPSLVDVLFGVYNPRGRLPFSIADSESAYGTVITNNSTGISTVHYKEQLLLDYRYMDSVSYKPRFEFGFGLSYTTFTYSDLSVSSRPANQGIIVTFVVENSGTRTGTEISQVYLEYPPAAGEPTRVLRGFKEILDLESGSHTTVNVFIAERELSIYDSLRGWIRPTGTFTAFVGASVKDIRLQGTIDL